MKDLDRITSDPNVMGGKPCIRGLRVTVGTIVGLVASGLSKKRYSNFTPILNQKTLKRHLLMPHGVLKK